MKNISGVMAVAVLAGCGPAWQGKVSGYSLEQREALYAITTDDTGASTGAVIVLTDQASLCPQLAVKTPPPNATMVAFLLQRTVDGKTLSPGPAEYIVVNSGIQNGNTVQGLFLKTDSNSSNEIPLAARGTASGMLKVTALSNESSTLSGTFEGKFGTQLDQVSTTFTATKCSISTDQLANGFLGGSGGGIKATCSRANCNGCCAADGTCQPGIQNYACGVSGNVCSSCGAGSTCSSGSCYSSPSFAGSCSTSTYCLEYTGSSWTASSVYSSCSTSSAYSSSRCPATGYGRCIMNRGLSTEYTFTYYSYSSTNSSSCTSNGGVFQQS